MLKFYGLEPYMLTVHSGRYGSLYCILAVKTPWKSELYFDPASNQQIGYGKDWLEKNYPITLGYSSPVPKNSLTKYKKATLLGNSKANEKKAALSDIISHGPPFIQAYAELSIEYMRSKDYKIALSLINLAIHLAPKYGRYYYQRSLLGLAMGNTGSRLLDLSQALNLGDSCEYALRDRADILYKVGRYGLALRDYEALLRNYGGFSAGDFYALSICYKKTGDSKRSSKYMKTARSMVSEQSFELIEMSDRLRELAVPNREKEIHDALMETY